MEGDGWRRKKRKMKKRDEKKKGKDENAVLGCNPVFQSPVTSIKSFAERNTTSLYILRRLFFK